MLSTNRFSTLLIYAGVLLNVGSCSSITFRRHTDLISIEQPKNITGEEFATELQRTPGSQKALNSLLLDVAQTNAMEPREKHSAITTLLYVRADAQTKDDQGESVLYKLIKCACTHDRDDRTSIERMLKTVSVKTEEGATLLEYAYCHKKDPVAQLLLNAGANHVHRADIQPYILLWPGFYNAITGLTALIFMPFIRPNI